MISFVLFPQASQPCMNFNISQLVFLCPVTPKSLFPVESEVLTTTITKVLDSCLSFTARLAASSLLPS